MGLSLSVEDTPSSRAAVDAHLQGREGMPLVQLAPMMDVTYRDFRQFLRILTRRTQMWTEMWVDNTLIHADKSHVDKYLDFHSNEHPIVCQLGGSNPATLAKAAKMVEARGYDEVNLNCGCPSDRVAGKGEFGASLMKNPQLVRDCMQSIANAVSIPVTVKCRLGVDEFDSPDFTAHFVRTVAEAGVRHFIIHARKAWLKGLSPEQNRNIPPLMYERVMRLCEEFPALQFTLNGGIVKLEHLKSILETAPKNLIGVMVGRMALNNPCELWDIDRYIFNEPTNACGNSISRHAILLEYCKYLETQYPVDGIASSDAAKGSEKGPSIGLVLKPLNGLFNGLRGNKLLRQTLNALSRDKELCANGPAAVVRRVVTVLEQNAAQVPALYEPLTAAGTLPDAADSVDSRRTTSVTSAADSTSTASGTQCHVAGEKGQAEQVRKNGDSFLVSDSCAVDEAPSLPEAASLVPTSCDLGAPGTCRLEAEIPLSSRSSIHEATIS